MSSLKPQSAAPLAVIAGEDGDYERLDLAREAQAGLYSVIASLVTAHERYGYAELHTRPRSRPVHALRPRPAVSRSLVDHCCIASQPQPASQ
jgi:hypothetical protein